MAEPGSFGGFWIRVLALLVDNAILTMALLLIVVASAFAGPAGALIAGVVPLLVYLLYFPAMHASARQATFGKALLGLKVEHAEGGGRISFMRALGRDLVGKFVSSLILGIGYLMAAFTGRKQALHDKIAATVVVRDSPGHLVAALAVAVLGYAAPFLFVMFLGAGMLGGAMAMMGGELLGVMKAEQAKQATKGVPAAPAPAKPAAPAAPSTPAPGAASAADVDKLLVPLTGLDKPGTTRAGPAVLELSTYFGNSPSIWVKVHVPLVVSRAAVVVTQVADTAGQGHYDPKHSLESEFFQNVQLSASSSGTPRMEGIRSVNLAKGTTEQQVQRIDGVLKLQVPVGVKTLSYRAADVGKAQEAGGIKLTLTSLKGADAEFSYAGSRANVVQFRSFDAKDAPVERQSTSWSGDTTGTQTMKHAAPVERIEVLVASELVNREHAFTLTRGGAPAGSAATPAVVKPTPAPVAPAAPAKPVAVVEPPKPAPAPVKVAPTPAPEKLAAAAPVVEAPKSKPAPRKRAAAPKPAAEPTAAAPSVPKAAPPPARLASMPGIAAPRYGDLVSAVLARDAKGVQELLDFGKWADKPDRRGTTPLMVAALLGDTASAEALLKAGADASKAETAAREKGDQAMLALLQRYRVTSPRP